jgi:DNA-directed RNA polymerase subunit RPC12/RpoP
MCADGQFQKLLEERFGDLDGIHCPYCSSRDLNKSPAIVVAVSAAFSKLLLGAMFPAKATIYECPNCLRSWRRQLGIPVYEASLTAVSAALAVGLITLLWFAFELSQYRTEYGAPTYPFSRYPSEYPTK